jgi:hypothetical protein
VSTVALGIRISWAFTQGASNRIEARMIERMSQLYRTLLREDITMVSSKADT